LEHGLVLTRKVFLLFRPRNFPLVHLWTLCNVNSYNRYGLGRCGSKSCHFVAVVVIAKICKSSFVREKDN
jgi:hypothetical protein